MKAFLADPENPFREFLVVCYQNPDKAKRDVDEFYDVQGSLADVKPDLIREVDEAMPWRLTGTKGDRAFCYLFRAAIGVAIGESIGGGLFMF